MPINEHGEMLIHIKGKVDDFNRKYSQVINKGEQMKQKFAQVAKFIAGAYVAGRIIGAFKNIIQSTIEMGVELDKLSKQWGMGVVDIQRLQYACEMANVDFNVMKTIIPKLAKAMGEARDNVATYKDEFDKMSISVDDGTGTLRNIYDVLLDMSDYMNDKTIPATEKLATMTALLGKRGVELIPLLIEQREQLKAWGDEAERMVGTLSEDMVKALEVANRNLKRLQATTAGFKVQIGVSTIPAIDKLIVRMSDLLTVTQEVNKEQKNWRAILDTIGRFISSGLGMNALKDYNKEVETGNVLLDGYFATVKEGSETTKSLADILEELAEAERKAAERLEKLTVLEGEWIGLEKQDMEAREEMQAIIDEQLESWMKEGNIKQQIAELTKRIGEEEANELLIEQRERLIEQQERIEREYRQIASAAQAAGAGMIYAFGKGENAGKALLKVLLRMYLRMIMIKKAAFAATIPGGFLFGGLGALIGLMGEGGMTAVVPKAAEGLVTKVDTPTITRHGVLAGEKYQTEWVFTGDQLTEYTKNLRPIFVIRNYTNRDIIVDEIRGTSESGKYELARILEDNVLQKQRDLDK